MRTKLRGAARIPVWALIVIIVLSFSIFTSSVSTAESRKIGRNASRPRNGMALKAEMNRIVGVLENKMKGRLLHGKVKDKLSTLSPEQIQLLDSLAARIIENDHTAASDIAFFLISALIVSS